MFVGDDIAFKTGPFFAPAWFDQHYIPRMRRVCDAYHAKGIKVLFHSDGNILEGIPSLIEWGVDIIDPVQPEVPDMDHVMLKRKFGDRLCFSGGVGAQEILPRGTVE